jgi:hypothetical protein
MKKKTLFVFLIYVASFVLAACGPQTLGTRNAAPESSSALVEFTGKVESVQGDQIVVNGQTLKLDPSSQAKSQFTVGDTVRVRAEVQADGSVIVKEIGSPNAVAFSGDPASPTATPTASSVAAPQEFIGTVDAVTPDEIVITGQPFIVTADTQFETAVFTGDTVKVQAVLNTDGTFTALAVNLADPTATPSPTIAPPANTPPPPPPGNDNDNGNDNNNDNDNGNSNDNGNGNDNNNDNGNDNDDDDDDNDNDNDNEDDDD